MLPDSLFVKMMFAWEPETSHHKALDMLAMASKVPGGLGMLRARYAPRKQKSVQVMGLTFPNQVGLAAGWDKEAKAYDGLAALGFGHVEVGTVCVMPQEGNPTPRIFRSVPDRSIINRMGFPSQGADVVLGRLQHRERSPDFLLGVNIGKNKKTPLEEAASDYVKLVDMFAEHADYLTVNVSSPNTPGLRKLQTGENLYKLLKSVLEARDAQTGKIGRRVPVAIKLAPDLNEADLDDALDAITRAGIDGLIITNTTLDRTGVDPEFAKETGGLSGAALTVKSRDFLKTVKGKVSSDLAVISVGGIMDADEAARRIDLGADLVQLYTGFIFGGPGLVRQCVERLA